ncbi:hypothetical protein Mgra_00002284 [Meloidogyne graminicola]|uniref:Uncharacterized protein n=1 Tax=Meloidogyne graminicola TaxID=189291 RepID=A0A8S9ZXC8_9BILA|nr:hypothetical protein Mgra_00002284 [Meloidogyne graminicola]
MEKLVSDNIDVKNVKNEFEPLQITGRGIVCGYLQLEPESVAKYLQIQEALKTFENWSESSRINFLEQFVDMYDILDGRFHDLVQQFCKIHWYDVPLCIRNRFVEFLTTLGIFQINHIEDVFTSFVTHLLPISRKESCIDPQEQQILYNMAHDSIKRVISCNKLSNRILVKYCTRLFPHVRQPADKMLAFVCNLIKLAEETDDEDTKIEIWSLLVDRLLQLDAATTDSYDEESRLSFCNNSNELYSPNVCLNCLSSDSEAIIDPISEEKLENPMETKLDQFVALILLFIGTRSGKSTEEMLKQIISKESGIYKNFEMLSLFLVKNNEEIMINKENNLKRGKTANNNISPIFQLFLEGFDEHVLTATGVHSTPFVWFYLCSLSKKNCQKMLEFLWEIILLPPNLRGDRRKSQNAATFLCGFLARANYIDFEFACSWLKNLSTWCLDYITKNSKNEVVKRNISPNIKITQHGIFFSIVQALLFVFCYRHEELNKKENALKEVYSWNLDKIVFNSLNPLQHISKGVTLCFLNLARRFNLFEKSTDNLPLLSNKTSLTNDLLLKHRKAVIDLFFPFSFCSLKICSPLLLPLMRRFSSLEKHYRNVVIDEDIEEEEEDNKRENNNNILQIDEGYEEELMCLKSVNEFNNYNIMYEGNNEEQQQMEI